MQDENKISFDNYIIIGEIIMPVDPYVGEIMMFGGDFAPRDWAPCNGQLLPIAQYQALFSLLGNVYGGDGRINFALPNLNGRVPMGTGTSNQGITVRRGDMGGNPETNLTENNLPSHTHAVTTPAIQAPLAGNATGPINASGDVADSTGPKNKYLGQTAGGTASEEVYTSTVNKPLTMKSTATVDLASGQASIPSQNYDTAATGAGLPFSNLPPYLGMQFCIALNGVYPSRN